MQSMTGFGRSIISSDGRELILELKSVNHRFLDISIRAPRVFGFLEDEIKKQIGGYISRGHIDVSINYRNTRADAKTVAVDTALLGQYMVAFENMRQTGVKGEPSMDAIAALPDILSVVANEEDREAIAAACTAALKEAGTQMCQMRSIEGQSLKLDLLAKLDAIQLNKNEIKQLAAGVSAELAEKLRTRLQELLGDIPLDEQRIAQELVIQADRLAIDEELVRLQAHLDNMRSYMEVNEPQGRKLEFLLQEINREVNTIGSKAMNVSVQSKVVTIKGELEKLREQVQNIE